MEEHADCSCRQGSTTVAGFRPPPPETPLESMEFLSRSWSVSSLEISRSLAPTPHLQRKAQSEGALSIPEDAAGEVEEADLVSGNPFSFASSVTSQLITERIMSQPQEVTPLSAGWLSHSSGPSNGGQSCGSFTDSPPVSPSGVVDSKHCRVNNPAKTQYWTVGIGSGGVGGVGGKTVGRWLKDRREKKKEESRAHNAQLHAAVSVAGVAAAVASIAAATASTSAAGKDEEMAKTDMAVASAATLVAAQCVEAAEALGAERDHLASVVSSAVNVRTPGDIMTLTAAAATALRGAATLKARALKEVWNIAAVIPVEKGLGNPAGAHSFSGELQTDGAQGVGSPEQLLAKGSELLKRTRKGALHWKVVSLYINRLGQVILKMKSRHVGGAITKKKKSVVLEVCEDIPAWPGRHLVEGGENRKYFGLRTAGRGLVEFECQSQREYERWTRGASALLRVVEERRRSRG